MIDALTAVLNVEGYNVISAQNGRQALELLNSSLPDLILLDITMPDLTGWEVCKKIKENRLTNLIPVLLISGKDEIKDKLMGIQVGADDYLTKPFDTEQLLNQIEEHLRSRRTLAQSTT